MLIRNEILENNILTRTIHRTKIEHFEVIACAVLIGYEYKWLSKIQFNLHSISGSLHIEYREKVISLYCSGDYDENELTIMTVSLIPLFGNSHTSTIKGYSVISCFNEYLRLSDQRSSSIGWKDNDLVRQEQLPPTEFLTLNGFLDSAEIKILS